MINVTRLKVTTEGEMLNVLESAGFTFNKDGSLRTASHVYFISLIDKLYTPTGNTLTEEEGNEYPETELLEGYFANLVTEDEDLISGVESITVEVETPSIKISGE